MNQAAYIDCCTTNHGTIVITLDGIKCVFSDSASYESSWDSDPCTGAAVGSDDWISCCWASGGVPVRDTVDGPYTRCERNRDCCEHRKTHGVPYDPVTCCTEEMTLECKAKGQVCRVVSDCLDMCYDPPTPDSVDSPDSLESASQESQPGDSQAPESSGPESQPQESQGQESQSQDSQSKSSEDSDTPESHPHDSQPSHDSTPADSQDSKQQESQSRPSQDSASATPPGPPDPPYPPESHPPESYPPESQSQESQSQDSQSQSQDSQSQSQESQDSQSQSRESQDSQSQSQDSQSQDSESVSESDSKCQASAECLYLVALFGGDPAQPDAAGARVRWDYDTCTCSGSCWDEELRAACENDEHIEGVPTGRWIPDDGFGHCWCEWPTQDSHESVDSTESSSHDSHSQESGDSYSASAESFDSASHDYDSHESTTPESYESSESTGPESTGPESTGPESTGPESTGPESTGPESHDSTSSFSSASDSNPCPDAEIKKRACELLQPEHSLTTIAVWDPDLCKCIARCDRDTRRDCEERLKGKWDDKSYVDADGNPVCICRFFEFDSPAGPGPESTGPGPESTGPGPGSGDGPGPESTGPGSGDGPGPESTGPGPGSGDGPESTGPGPESTGPGPGSGDGPGPESTGPGPDDPDPGPDDPDPEPDSDPSPGDSGSGSLSEDCEKARAYCETMWNAGIEATFDADTCTCNEADCPGSEEQFLLAAKACEEVLHCQYKHSTNFGPDGAAYFTDCRCDCSGGDSGSAGDSGSGSDSASGGGDSNSKDPCEFWNKLKACNCGTAVPDGTGNCVCDCKTPECAQIEEEYEVTLDPSDCTIPGMGMGDTPPGGGNYENGFPGRYPYSNYA